MQTDLTHGTRLLDWHAVCGKATAAEARDLRVVLHGWTDEFTPIDGLSQKARVHKYGVVLVSNVNLPLRLRHYADFILMRSYSTIAGTRLPFYNPLPSPRTSPAPPTRAPTLASRFTLALFPLSPTFPCSDALTGSSNRYAKANGELTRMLTGIGADGTKHKEGVTFASELALGEESPLIELPNDANPAGEPLTFRLRLFLLLMSLDWLAGTISL